MDAEMQEQFMRTWLDSSIGYDDTVQHYPYSLPTNALTFASYGHLVRAVDESGSKFFTPDTMRCFGSRTVNWLCAGRLFITSTRPPMWSDGTRDPREYHVRWVYQTPDAHHLSIDRFKPVASLYLARKLAKDACVVFGWDWTHAA